MLSHSPWGKIRQGQKGGGNMTTPCCPRTRPHTNSFYCFSRNKATLQEGVAVFLSVMPLERFCKAFVFCPSRSNSWPFIGDWDKDQFKWQLCLTLRLCSTTKTFLIDFSRFRDQKSLLMNAIFVLQDGFFFKFSEWTQLATEHWGPLRQYKH